MKKGNLRGAGIDLHKRYLTLCVLDPDGNAVVQHRRLSTDGLFAVLGQLDGPITVAVEATLHWAWLHDHLVQHGYSVQVADLLRSNLVPAIWLPDPTTRANRKLLRGYAFLVRNRARIKYRIHTYLAEINLASPATDFFGKQGRIWIDSLSLPGEVRFQVDGLLKLLDFLETRIRRVAKRIEQRVETTPEAQLLMSVPGIGAKTAMLIMAEIGTLDRFPSSHDLTSFAGLVPTTRSSGGKTTHRSLPHAGSPWLRRALVESTQTLMMKPGPVRSHFTRLVWAKGNSKATVAAARKLCCYLFWMLKEGRTYADWLHNRNNHHLLEVRPT